VDFEDGKMAATSPETPLLIATELRSRAAIKQGHLDNATYDSRYCEGAAQNGAQKALFPHPSSHPS